MKSDQAAHRLAESVTNQATTLEGLQNGMLNLSGKFDDLTAAQTDATTATTASIKDLSARMEQLFVLVNRQIGGNVPAVSRNQTDDDVDLVTPQPAGGKRRATGSGPQANSTDS